MWVVKLGGSLSDTDHLLEWLTALAPYPVILVPGGGDFADAVRAAQTRWHFNEHAAHRMAILAMRQFGLMLADLGKLACASRLSALKPWPRAATVWLPDPDELDIAGIAPSWDTTSDSLAAWLAGFIGASRLLIVKSLEMPPQQLSCADLSNSGVLDRNFAAYYRFSRCQAWLALRGDHAKIRAGDLNSIPGDFTAVDFLHLNLL
jgi:hypothetical protein